jgi:putative ABC transport system substrate-binding protein
MREIVGREMTLGSESAGLGSAKLLDRQLLHRTPSWGVISPDIAVVVEAHGGVVEIGIDRRRLILGLGSAAVLPPEARAQHGERLRRIALLMGGAEEDFGSRSYVAAFFSRFEELGWKSGFSIRADLRWWNGGPAQMQPVIAEMLASSPEVIIVFTNLALAGVKPMAGSVPIVFVAVGDPVGSGFVASLAHPGGNITGFASYDGPMGAKWLDVL